MSEKFPWCVYCKRPLVGADLWMRRNAKEILNDPKKCSECTAKEGERKT
jgi:hypothetical protein